MVDAGVQLPLPLLTHDLARSAGLQVGRRRSDVTMGTKDFWLEPDDETRIKMDMVTDDFLAWKSVICNQLHLYAKDFAPLAYIDLYAGRGRYKNGEAATAVRIAEAVAGDPDLARRVMLVVNEGHRETFAALTQHLDAVPGIAALRHKPVIENTDALDAIARYVRTYRDVAKLVFIDPWGWNILSRDLLQTVVEGWGSDCIFFFNNRRIRLGLTNPEVEMTINKLFGTARARRLRWQSAGRHAQAVDELIVRAMDDMLEERGLHATRFLFLHRNGKIYTHSLWTTSKVPRAIQLMRRIGARRASVPASYPPTIAYYPPQAPAWAAPPRPLFGSWQADLCADLCACFATQTLTVEQVILHHHRRTNYTDAAYKEVLVGMVRQNRVRADRPIQNRRIGPRGTPTIGDKVRLTF
jgi:three-Cys-motif partner protein